MRLFAATVDCPVHCATVSAQTPRPPQTMPDVSAGQYATLKRNLTGAAEKMPAEHFTFRPTPEVRTYAELFAHTIDTQIYFCNTGEGRGQSDRREEPRETVTDKAGVMQMVKDGFAYCDDVFASLTDEKLATMIAVGTAPNTRQIAAGTVDDGRRARQRALRQSRHLHADQGDCAARLQLLNSVEIVPAFQGSKVPGDEQPWNSGTVEPWNRVYGLGRRSSLQRDRPAWLHVHVQLEILEAGHADFDLVPARFEPQLLERAVEVVHQSRVVAIDEHLRVARPDPQPHAAEVIADR